ncbi:MAG: flagellar FliJ family protein [Steroidobacteraceae bacterium]
MALLAWESGNSRAFLAKLAEAVLQQEELLRKAQSDSESEQTNWQGAAQRSQIIDKVVDRHAAKETKARDQRDQRESDDRGHARQLGGSTRMGIDTSALALGAATPAKAGYPAAAQADAGQGSQPGATPASGSSDSGTGAGGTDPSSSSAANPKTTGPSAQTRGKARAHSRSNAAAAAGNQPSMDPKDVAQDPVGDFGSVMATALGRSTAVSSGGSGVSAPAADTTDSATPTTPDQSTAGTPGDAVAWIVQALMPTAIATPPLATVSDTPDTAVKAAPLTGLPTKASSAPAQVQSPGHFAAQAAAQDNAATANGTGIPANAIRTPLNADPGAADPGGTGPGGAEQRCATRGRDWRGAEYRQCAGRRAKPDLRSDRHQGRRCRS